MQSAYDLFESTQKQIEGLCAERNALILVLAAKQQQVDGLVAERDELRELLAVARNTAAFWSDLHSGNNPDQVIFDVSSVRDDAIDDLDDGPDPFEDC